MASHPTNPRTSTKKQLRKKMNWPHDEDGNPMQIIMYTTSESFKMFQDSKDSPWKKVEFGIMRPVVMGAADELREDRQKLIADTESVVCEQRDVILREVS
jgi:hypothetical protein